MENFNLTFNFTYYGQSITRKEFEKYAPADWQERLDEFDEFHWGAYKASGYEKKEETF
jgi:hypothetical protein